MRRESREQFFKSEFSLTEDPEDLEEAKKEKKDNKRPVTGGAGNTFTLSRHPKLSTILIKIDAQLQA
jgi:hypothetical protein